MVLLCSSVGVYRLVTVIVAMLLMHAPYGNGIIVGTMARPFKHLERRQCSTTLNFANTVANDMQSHYYNSSTGQYNNGELWTDVNALEDLHNLMLATGNNDFGTIADGSYLGQAALNNNTDWNTFIGGSFDDAQWCILALWKIADYKAARQQDFNAYLNAASSIYDIISNQWDDTTCGGGGVRTDMNEPDANRAKTMDNFKVRKPRVAPTVWWFIHGSSTAIIGYMYVDELIDNVIYQSVMNVQASNEY